MSFNSFLCTSLILGLTYHFFRRFPIYLHYVITLKFCKMHERKKMEEKTLDKTLLLAFTFCKTRHNLEHKLALHFGNRFLSFKFD